MGPTPLSRLQQIAPRLWQLEFCLPFTTNVWFLLEDDGLTIVDCGYWWNAATIYRTAVGLGHPIRRILLTHAHPDHAGSAAELVRRTGAEVLAHPSDIPYLTGARSMIENDGWWVTRTILHVLHQVHVLEPPPLRTLTPVREGDQVGRLLVLHSPGHTPGSASFWDAEDEALLCGDNAQFTFRFLHLGVSWFTLDPPLRNRSVRRYCDFPARRLLAGHGPVFEGDVPAALARLLPA